jgi:hypothetical protein
MWMDCGRCTRGLRSRIGRSSLVWCWQLVGVVGIPLGTQEIFALQANRSEWYAWGGRQDALHSLLRASMFIVWGLSLLVEGASSDDGLVAVVPAVQPFMEYIIPTYRSLQPTY